VSYFARITGGAAAGARPGTGLVPAGRVASPLAKIDQRLHLISARGLGELAAPPGAGRRAAGEEDSLFENPFEQGEAAGTGLSLGDGALAGAGGETPGAGQGTSFGRGTHPAPPPWSTRERSSEMERESAVLGPDDARGPRGSADAQRFATTPAAGSSRRDPHGRAIDETRTPSGALGLPVAAALEKLGRGGGAGSGTAPSEASSPRGAEGTAAAGGDPMAVALSDALGKVSRWMAGEPRPRAEARAQQDPGDGDVARSRAMPGARGARASLRSQDPFAPAGAHFAAAHPRFSVGRIDVQVVPPPVIAPPAPVARAPRAAAAPAGESSLPSYLTFGLRQR
jgi:hypothetical protein